MDAITLFQVVASLSGITALLALGRYLDATVLVKHSTPEILTSSFPYLFSIVLPLSGLALLFFIAGTRLLAHVHSLQSSAPSIEFGDGNIVYAGAYKQTGFVGRDRDLDKSNPIGDFTIVRIPVHNNPKVKLHSADVLKAVVRLTYFSEDGNQILHMWGKWSGNPQANTRPSHIPIEDLREMDIPANNSDRWIDIGLQYQGDTEWYATNNQSDRYASTGKWDKYRLPLPAVIVRVRISGGQYATRCHWLVQSALPLRK
jgi:hypothetical protein